ncbi:MAG: hypothetical protein K0U98_05770 [Deltaproteobacteria bacterium]|nr:hypothetical protein [Deltaproteobacteria bacterium]
MSNRRNQEANNTNWLQEQLKLTLYRILDGAVRLASLFLKADLREIRHEEWLADLEYMWLQGDQGTATQWVFDLLKAHAWEAERLGRPWIVVRRWALEPLVESCRLTVTGISKGTRALFLTSRRWIFEPLVESYRSTIETSTKGARTLSDNLGSALLKTEQRTRILVVALVMVLVPLCLLQCFSTLSNAQPIVISEEQLLPMPEEPLEILLTPADLAVQRDWFLDELATSPDWDQKNLCRNKHPRCQSVRGPELASRFSCNWD